MDMNDYAHGMSQCARQGPWHGAINGVNGKSYNYNKT